MGIGKHPERRRRLVFVLAMSLIFGSVLTLGLTALANHPANSCLDLHPEDEANPVGTTHTVTATLRQEVPANTTPPTEATPARCADENDSNSAVPAESDTTIDFEITGANDPDDSNTPASPDRTCTIPQGQSSCVMPGYSGLESGTDLIRGWIRGHARDADEPVDESDEYGDPFLGGGDEPDDTDVVQKRWIASSEGVSIDCLPESDLNPSGSSHTITCTVRDTQANPEQGVNVDMEASGTNGSDDSPASPDFTCTTESNGQCSMTHGPAGSGSTDSAGRTTYRAWIDADDSNSTVEADPFEEPGTEDNDNTDVVTKDWGASRLDCTPETDRNPTGASHSIVCNSRSANNAGVSGSNIDIEATGANDPDNSNSINTPDFTCTTTDQGTCAIIHGPGGTGTTDQSGTTAYRAWIDIDNDNATTTDVDTAETQVEGATDEPDNTDVVEKSWIASRVDCSPESDVNPAETAHTVTCRTTDSTGAGVSGMQIDAEATGENDPDGSDSPTSPDFACTTGTDGNCSFTHGPGGRGTTTELGQTVYRAWIDADGNDSTVEADPREERDETRTGASPTPGSTSTTSPSPSGSPTGSPSPSGSPTGSPSPSGSPTSSPAGARVAQQQSPTPTSSPTSSPTPTQSIPPGAGDRAEPDDTDVVEKNWSAVPARLEIIPETDSAPVGSCNAFTITATDDEGNAVQGVVVDAEQRHATSDDTTANNEPHVSFCRPDVTDGANPSDVDETRGDLGNGLDGNVGGEALNPTDTEGKVTIGIRVRPQSGSNGQGTVLLTVFYENEDNDDPDGTDPQDSATKTWIPSEARTIDCSPEEATNRVGTEHTVTCTVRDANGDTVQGEGVTFSEEGPGEFTSDTQRNTNAQGQATVTATSNESGTQTITGSLTSSTEGEPDTDECDRAAGDPQDAPAGQCADSVEKEWRPGQRVGSGPCRGFFQGTSSDRAGGGQVIVGTNGSDVLRGTDENDIICGLGGKDTLVGRGGRDRLAGGNGNDILRGNAGGDRLQGNRGEDTIAGGGGNDRANGGIDDDIIRGGGGNDTLIGKGGQDVLRGRGGRDDLRGNGGKDNLNGGRGRDTLDGGRGTDVCRPGSGNDRLRRCER